MLVDAAGDVFVVVTLHQDGRAAGRLDVLDAATQFAHAFGEGLAAFVGDYGRNLVDVFFQ